MDIDDDGWHLKVKIKIHDEILHRTWRFCPNVFPHPDRVLQEQDYLSEFLSI
jgi:hypothetical protein